MFSSNSQFRNLALRLRKAKEAIKMVLVEHIQHKADKRLERVLGSIRRFFQKELHEGETLEIQWGTKTAFELLDKGVTQGLREKRRYQRS